MKFNAYHDCGWYTDDAAHLYFYKTASQPTPPETLTCHVIGHSGLVEPCTIDVRTDNLTFLGAAQFGEARGSTHTKWTGNAYKFGIYSISEHFLRHDIVILRQDGGGMHPFIVRELEADLTWTTLCSVVPQPILWNLCQSLTHTYRKGVDDERRRVYTLFLAGKLKKRRYEGRARVQETA